MSVRFTRPPSNDSSYVDSPFSVERSQLTGSRGVKRSLDGTPKADPGLYGNTERSYRQISERLAILEERISNLELPVDEWEPMSYESSSDDEQECKKLKRN